MNRINVDTDQIIPKQFLKRIERTGFGAYLFHDWRFLDTGEPNPDFVLNAPRYQGASVLVAGLNFGCGSSREHAPWSIQDYGFEAVIAPSFGDIFSNNCYKNGILPVILSEQICRKSHGTDRGARGLHVDNRSRKSQNVIQPDGVAHPFEIGDFQKQCLLKRLG